MTPAFSPPSYSNAPDVNWATADLCDQALEDPSWGLRVLPPVYRSMGGRPWYFGQVLTVSAPQADGAASLADLLSQAGSNRVLVVDAKGQPVHAILGDRMAGMAVQNGWAGIVIHGYVRDTRVLARMPLGVHALGSMPNRPAAMPLAQITEQVSLHGSVIRNGDWLYADDDGIIILARRHTAGSPPG